MTVAQKMVFFETLIRCGFKEIEVAYPAASDTDFNFVRKLIEEDKVPEDVWLQVSIAVPSLSPCLVFDSMGKRRSGARICKTSASVVEYSRCCMNDPPHWKRYQHCLLMHVLRKVAFIYHTAACGSSPRRSGTHIEMILT